MKIIPNTFHLISLGCAKNLVDSQGLWSLLSQQGFTLVEDPNQAEFIIINTCGFIHDARQESLQALQEFSEHKRRGQKLIAAGCLTERYRAELLASVPGIDGLMGTRDLADILPLMRILSEHSQPHSEVYFPNHAHIVNHPELPGYVIQGGSSYLKIADGCRRSCAFCAIPGIKGTLTSRPKDDILKDAFALQAAGVQEINIIAQDVTDYGQDLGLQDGLPNLLADLLPVIPHIPWVRLLYTYPGYISDRLIDMMVEFPQLLPYLDIPLQHADPKVLQLMRRPSDVDWVRHTVAKMRAKLPDLVIRTTFIVGFPGESEHSFQVLKDFLEEMQFDHVGVFTYSMENGTSAQILGDPIPQKVKEARRQELMTLQAGISYQKNQKLCGKVLNMLVEGVDQENGVLIGRTYRDAPEIDGLVIAEGTGDVGELLPVRITAAMQHDLFGQVL
ncbi:MAG TPA: 30S ribosomal protein S12 methylthiotransferase RimO [Anaerolineaceae bacterium]|nr:30S ribosomal protein S12 methylthiotransferase RimO [Anaerolineaceae bacterium]